MQSRAATFGWLCVETLIAKSSYRKLRLQPPSGGCVLKPTTFKNWSTSINAATFGWLCVETTTNKEIASNTARQLPLGSYLLKPDLIKLNSIIFTALLLYLSTQFIANHIPPCFSPLFALDYAPFLAFMIYNYACFWLSFWLTWWADCSLP